MEKNVLQCPLITRPRYVHLFNKSVTFRNHAPFYSCRLQRETVRTQYIELCALFFITIRWVQIECVISGEGVGNDDETLNQDVSELLHTAPEGDVVTAVTDLKAIADPILRLPSMFQSAICKSPRKTCDIVQP